MKDQYDGLTKNNIISEFDFENSGRVNSNAIEPLYRLVPTGNIAADGTPEFKLKEAGANIYDNTTVTTEHTYRLTHEGKMFFVSKLFDNVPAEGKVYLRHYGATTKNLNSILNLKAGGEWIIRTFSGTTYTANGTELTPVNRKSGQTEQLETIFTHSPTINVFGSKRLEEKFGYGTTARSSTTGNSSEPLESVFLPGEDILIELENTNRSGDYYISSRFDVYEDIDGEI